MSPLRKVATSNIVQLLEIVYQILSDEYIQNQRYNVSISVMRSSGNNVH